MIYREPYGKRNVRHDVHANVYILFVFGLHKTENNIYKFYKGFSVCFCAIYNKVKS